MFFMHKWQVSSKPLDSLNEKGRGPAARTGQS
jgi:hypothetical protein